MWSLSIIVKFSNPAPLQPHIKIFRSEFQTSYKCILNLFAHIEHDLRVFPGGPVAKTSPSNAGGAGLIPTRGGKIPHASGPKKTPTKHKTNSIVKFHKDF